MDAIKGNTSTNSTVQSLCTALHCVDPEIYFFVCVFIFYLCNVCIQKIFIRKNQYLLSIFLPQTVCLFVCLFFCLFDCFFFHFFLLIFFICVYQKACNECSKVTVFFLWHLKQKWVCKLWFSLVFGMDNQRVDSGWVHSFFFVNCEFVKKQSFYVECAIEYVR